MTYDAPPPVPPTAAAPDTSARAGVNGSLVAFGLLLVLGAVMAVVVPATADVVAWERVMPIALVALGVLLAAGGAFGLLRRRRR